MGVKITDFLKIFNKGGIADAETTGYTKEQLSQLAYKKLAVETCISLIANTISLGEFQTFEKGKKIRSNNYYALNVQPNKNQNASEFWRQVISKLYKKNECLVVMVNNEYFVADSFEHKENALIEDEYYDIEIRDYKLSDRFLEHEVLYFKLHDEDISKIINSMYADYSKLLTWTMEAYKKTQGRKGFLKIKANYAQTKDAQTKLDNLLNDQFKKWFENDNAIIPIRDGLEFEESKIQGQSQNTRDIKAVVGDIFDFVCWGFHIPTGLAKGNVAGLSDIIDSYIMFCIKPIAKIIENEASRKIYTKEQYLERTYLKLNLQKIKLIDIQKLATTSDLLLRNGTHSINDNLEMLDLEPKMEQWAKEHYVTKNYQKVVDGEYTERPEKENKKE